MTVLQFKGKTAIECYHHTVAHHTLEFDAKLSVLEKGEKPALDWNLIFEGDNLVALKALLPTQRRLGTMSKSARFGFPSAPHLSMLWAKRSRAKNNNHWQIKDLITGFCLLTARFA